MAVAVATAAGEARTAAISSSSSSAISAVPLKTWTLGIIVMQTRTHPLARVLVLGKALTGRLLYIDHRGVQVEIEVGRDVTQMAVSH